MYWKWQVPQKLNSWLLLPSNLQLKEKTFTYVIPFLSVYPPSERMNLFLSVCEKNLKSEYSPSENHPRACAIGFQVLFLFNLPVSKIIIIISDSLAQRRYVILQPTEQSFHTRSVWGYHLFFPHHLCISQQVTLEQLDRQVFQYVGRPRPCLFLPIHCSHISDDCLSSNGQQVR